jgi:hypothetical protein
MELVVTIILNIMAVYLILGIIFSIYFLLKGMIKLDDGTMNSPWHFKLIIWPGVVLFWSVLLFKLMRK